MTLIPELPDNAELPETPELSRSAPSEEPHEEQLEALPDFDCIIVGGGLAGLVAARDLAIGGVSVALLEGSDRLGGKLSAQQLDGLSLDAGADSFATRNAELLAYLGKIGLGEQIVFPRSSQQWLQLPIGKAKPLPQQNVLGIPAVPLASEVIDIVGLGGALRAQWDALLPGLVGSSKPSLGGFVRARMGAKVLQRLVAPLAIARWGRHPDELQLDSVAPELRRGLKQEESLASAVRALLSQSQGDSGTASLRGGLSSLVATLTHDLDRFGVTVRLSTPVAALDAEGIELADGSRLLARQVILAAPDAGLTGRAPAVGPASTSVVLVTLVVTSAQLDGAPRDSGVIVAPGVPGVVAREVNHLSATWAWLDEQAGEHRHVLRLRYDGEAATATSETALRAQALSEATALLGVPLGEAELRAFSRHEWTMGERDPRAIPDTLVLIGETAAGPELGGIITQARASAARIITELAELDDNAAPDAHTPTTPAEGHPA